MLVAYLALAAGRPQARGKLVSLLWSDRAEPQARASLRQELHALRHALAGVAPSALQVTADTLLLDPAMVAVDALLFEELAGRPEQEALGHAATLYRGDLLEGMPLREGPIDDWLTPERGRLRDLATMTLAKLLGRRMADAAPAAATATARRLLALDPAHEGAHRALMRLLARAGDRRAALRQYQRCSSILARELGVEPEEETKRLYLELLRRTPAPAGTPGPAAGSASGAMRLAAPAGLAPLPLSGGRRRLTVAYVDLVGSTALATRLDPEELLDVLDRFDRTVTEIVDRFGGRICYRQGDGLLACFGWPWAHEDDAERAVRAAVAATVAVSRLRLASVPTMACRAGVATGLVVVGGGADELAVVGEAPNLAARLQAMGKPGMVLVCAATRAQLGSLFELESAGRRQLKGYDVAVPAWRVVGDGGAESRFEALRGSDLIPLVGRRAPLAQLLDLWHRIQDGDGQVVLLTGEAGIGKSRLVRALRERLVTQRCVQLGLFCSPHHEGTAFHPVIGLLERAAGLRREDPPERRFEMLAALLARAGAVSADAPRILGGLLGIALAGANTGPELSAARRKERVFEALLEQLAGLAAQAPLLLHYDDVHWADASTLELLLRVVERVRNLPVLVVIAYRPDFVPPWTGLDHVTPVELRPLARADAVAMVREVARGDASVEAVEEQILERADGVPLYIEELTRAVLAQAAGLAGGACREPGGGAAEPSVPATLHGSLMLQLDHLAPGKQVAQAAAVIGREFQPLLLGPLCALAEADCERGLEQLVAAGLVYPISPSGRDAYAFKHALVRDAAYESLLGSDRRELHARIAHALVRLFPQLAADEPEIVADHFARAGLAPEAIHHLARAAERAVARYANAEAVGHYRKALALVDGLPAGPDRQRMELLLQTGLGVPLMASLGYSAPPVRQVFDRARELCGTLPEEPALCPILFGLSAYYTVKSDLAAARPLASRCLAAARASRDDDALLAACSVAGAVQLYHGRLLAARTLLNLGFALYRPGHHPSHAAQFGQDPISPLAFIARTEALLGHPDLALRWADRLAAVAQDPKTQPNTAGALHAHLAQLHLLLRDPAEALRHATAGISLASRQKLPLWLGLGQMYRGAAVLGLAGNDQTMLDEGMREGLEGLATYRATGAGLDVPTCLCWLAEGEARLGRPTAGLQMLDEAMRIMAATGETYFAAEAHRIAAELGLAMPDRDPAEAEASLRTGLAIARRQRSRLLELRASVAIARVHGAQGRLPVSDELLPLARSFPDDIVCSDLSEARALLAAGGT